MINTQFLLRICVKKEPRLLAIRSGKWDKEREFISGYFLLLQHPSLVVGFASCQFRTDGSDATERIIETIQTRKFPANYILLKGITIAGLNFVDPFRLFEELDVPVLVITDSTRGGLLEAATKHSANASQIRSILTKLQTPLEVNTSFGTIGLQCVGEKLQVAKRLVLESALASKFPEPLRILRIISKGLDCKK